jgi:hypothetical protein
LRLAGSARVAIAAVSIGLGVAACGSTDEPAAESTATSTADTASASTSGTAVAEPGVSEAEVTELEQQLDEIDRVLADLEVQLSED